MAKTLLLFLFLLIVIELVVSVPLAQIKQIVVNVQDSDTTIRLLAREIEKMSIQLVGSHKVIDSPKTYKAVASLLEKVPESNRYRMSLEVETIGVLQSNEANNNLSVQDTDFLQLASVTLENAKSILATPRASSSATYTITSPKIEKLSDEIQIKHRMSFEMEPVSLSYTRRKRSVKGKSNIPNIIKQVIKALEGREDMINTIEYLEKSADDEDLLRHLPLANAGMINMMNKYI